MNEFYEIAPPSSKDDTPFVESKKAKRYVKIDIDPEMSKLRYLNVIPYIIIIYTIFPYVQLLFFNSPKVSKFQG